MVPQEGASKSSTGPFKGPDSLEDFLGSPPSAEGGLDLQFYLEGATEQETGKQAIKDNPQR